MLDFALHPVAFLLYLAIVGGVLTLLIRKQNEIDFNIDDDEQDETELADSDDIITEEPENFNLSEDKPEDDGRLTKPKPIENSTKRKVARKERKTSEPSVNREITFKSHQEKKVTSNEINKSGPIMKTKRKRLVSSDDTNEKLNLLTQGRTKSKD